MSTSDGNEHQFVVGEEYTRNEIREALGGGPTGYLPHKDGRVVCGTLTPGLNPRGPDVVLVGPGPETVRWAEVLCEQRYPVPMFVKSGYARWGYRGEYEVNRSTAARRDIAKQERASGRTDNVRVMFLRKVR